MYISENYKAGDVLRVKRGLYSHFGVYVGNGQVVHFSAGNNGELNPRKAKIMLTFLQYFENGGQSKRCNRNPFERDSNKDIAQRALSLVGTKFGGYNLITNNCEHFARFCENRIRFSDQVHTVVSIAAIVFVQFFVKNIYLMSI